MKIIFIAGVHGVGKGTISDILTKKYQLEAFSSSSLIKSEKSNIIDILNAEYDNIFFDKNDILNSFMLFECLALAPCRFFERNDSTKISAFTRNDKDIIDEIRTHDKKLKRKTGGSKGDKNSKKIIHIGGSEDTKVIILEKPINVSKILKYNDSKIKSTSVKPASLPSLLIAWRTPRQSVPPKP